MPGGPHGMAHAASHGPLFFPLRPAEDHLVALCYPRNMSQPVKLSDNLVLDARIAVVAFGDLTVKGDKIVATSFTHNLETTKRSLQKIPRYGCNEV